MEKKLRKKFVYISCGVVFFVLLSILMDNAVKYGREHSDILVSLKESNKKTVIEIQNEADHLKPMHYDMIFERFYRLETSRNSELGGYGIGLSVAKAIVKNHGGSIKAHSPDGERMLISITL